MQPADGPSVDISGRALAFTCRIAQLARSIPKRSGTTRVADQLVGAAGGIGANLAEARAASTRREFLRFHEISLRASRRTVYWLTVCERVGLAPPNVCRELLDETDRIARTIAAIVVTTRKNGV